MKMSIIILRNVQNFMSNENLNANSKFYSLVFLCQMENYSNKDFIQYSINFFFDMFNVYTSKPDEENWVKHMSLVIKKISSLMRWFLDPNYLSLQYYVSLGGEKFVDLGLGTQRVKCRVHNDFR